MSQKNIPLPSPSTELLYTLEGLQNLHKTFLRRLSETSGSLDYLTKASHFELFVQDLFNISFSVKALKQRYARLHALPKFRRDFIQRYVLRLPSLSPQESYATVVDYFSKELGPSFEEDEILFAEHVNHKLIKQAPCPKTFYWETQYVLHKLSTKEGHHLNKHAKSPFSPNDGTWSCPVNTQTDRQGFNLTDPGRSDAYMMEEAGYCLKCHLRDKDTCRTGLPEKENVPPLTGCPLDQKISEMIQLIESGHLFSALALVMVDNPLVAATGHRICNDCQRSCIFQHQTPVDVPQIETRLLKDVLDLPYGFEIYSLLTRWNPFNAEAPLPLPPTNRSVFIAGAGPAGFTLAHHLMRLGHSVFVAEGLKIDPLPTHLVSADSSLIEDIHPLFSPLENRKIKGFGGVMEYGITARWEKNFLLVIRLILERNPLFHKADGIRLGRTLTSNDVFNAGLDHISLCTGAGKPHMLPFSEMPNGVRMGVDLLMDLHFDSFKNKKFKRLIKLPAYIYGAGLTAIDTATEVLAAYEEQLKQLSNIHQKNPDLLSHISAEDLKEFLEHAGLLSQAKTSQERKKHLKDWGGVTILYRKPLADSPSYRQSPHEVENALYEGIIIQENTVLKSWETKDNHLTSLVVHNAQTNQEKTLPAKTLFLALGTKPNTTVLEEDPVLKEKVSIPLTFYDSQKNEKHPSINPKAPQPFFVHFSEEGKAITALGDLHPTYEGSVVKAMASAKQAAPIISQHIHSLSNHTSLNLSTYADTFKTKITHAHLASDHILELHIKAPAHVKHYQLGHFYKIQAYPHSLLTFLNGKAITPLEVNKEKGTFKCLIHLKDSHQSISVSLPEEVYLLGPIGAPLKLREEEKVQVISNPLDFYTLSLATALNKQNQLATFKLSASAPQSANAVLEKEFQLSQLLEARKPPTTLLISKKALTPEIKEHAQAKNLKILLLQASSLQCMMGGVCAHCLQPDPNHSGKWIFSCQNKLIKIKFK